MKKHVFRISVGLMALAFSVLTSCQKMASEELSSLAGEDETAIETSEQQIDQDADEASFRLECKPEHFDNCATVTEEFPEGGEFPKVVTIDFGSEECNGRRGKMIVTMTGDIRQEGSQRIVTFEDFYHRDNQVQGTRTLENVGLNESGNVVFSINDDVSITDDKGTHTRTRVGEKEWISGLETEDRMDDEFYLTGTETGTHCDGKEISKTIIKPIHISASCKYPLSGVIEAIGGKGDHTLDFGPGTCDDKAVITSEKGTKEINLDDLHK